MSDWVERARELRQRGNSWPVVARIVGRSEMQVRYALNEGLRARMKLLSKIRRESMKAQKYDS
jgi:hypothetical protein